MRGKLGITAGVVFGSGLLLATSVLAGGFAIREQSTTGLGNAFAGSATGLDLSSMYWNPAAVTSQDGLNSLSSYTLILPDTEITPTTGAASQIGVLGLVGSSYYNYQLSDQLYVGLSLNAPLGLTTEADNRTWGGQEHNRKSEMLTLNAAPTIGYKLMPNLTVAAGVQVEYIKVRLQSAHTTFNANDGVIKGDGVGYGFTGGLSYQPTSGTNIGLGYRSAIHHELEGTQHVTNLAAPFDIHADLTHPQMITAGISQKLSDAFTLLGNFEWTGWSSLKEMRVIRSSDGVTTTLENYAWNDSWYASVGGEMRLSDSLTGRAGLGYEATPVPDGTRGARLPDSDRVWLSLGGTYKWSEATLIDFGYSHVFFDDASINLAASGAKDALNATVDNSADIVSAGMRVKW